MASSARHGRTTIDRRGALASLSYTEATGGTGGGDGAKPRGANHKLPINTATSAAAIAVQPHMLRRGLGPGVAASEHVGAHRPRDVLQALLPQVDEGHVQFVANLLVSRRRKTDGARLANSLEPRSDVDPVAHQIAVALLDDVAQVNADASLDTLAGGQAGVALSQAATHFHGAAHGLDHAAKFDERTVAGPLDDPPVVNRDRRVDQVAAQRA